MVNPHARSTRRETTLAIKIGHLLEAQATGWAVCIVPLVLSLVLATAVATLLLR